MPPSTSSGGGRSGLLRRPRLSTFIHPAAALPTPHPATRAQLLSVCIGSYLSGGLIYFADIITRRLGECC